MGNDFGWEEAARLLQEGVAQLGLTLSTNQKVALLRHLQEVDRWNRRIRLTAIPPGRDAVLRHTLDSLLYLKGFTPREGLRLMDVGSGAGFPGIPLKILHPEMEVYLVEASIKKSAFLHHLCRVLHLSGVHVWTLRVERLAYAGGRDTPLMDVVVARALAPTARVVQWVAPLVHPGGRIVISRGRNVHWEREAWSRQEIIQGWKIQSILSLHIPLTSQQRHLILFQSASFS